MVPSEWNSIYKQILIDFDYNEEKDRESAKILDSIIKNPFPLKEIENKIKSKSVFIIGAGPSLELAIPFLKKFKNITKIVADSALEHIMSEGIIPDMVVTDLDGNIDSLKKMGLTDVIFIVHAHGDNINKLELARSFKNCIGTTQSKPVGKLQNFGGFTDGDRSVFLANFFKAKNIILFGMDLGDKVGKFSNTKEYEIKTKLKKIQKAKFLLEWLAIRSESRLFTTSSTIIGFEEISFQEIDTIIT